MFTVVRLDTSEQLRSNNAQTPGKTGHHKGPEDEARHYESRPCTVCKTSIPGSNPGGASIFLRSVPDTWVTVHSGDMGNTLARNGLSIGSRRQVSSSK